MIISQCTIVHVHCISVPLGIILKSETKHDEMVDILEHLQQYVPSVTTTEKVSAPGQPEPAEISVDKFHHLTLGKLLEFCV